MADNTFFTILSDLGRSKLANAIALGRKIELTAMAVGDGGGGPVQPSGGMTGLVREVYRHEVNLLSVDPDNPAYVLADLIIPVDTGGWYIREAAIFDAEGDLFAIGSLPESYKPVLAEGVGTDFYVRLVLDVQNSAAITLKVDPAIVLASQRWVNARLEEYVKTGRRINTVGPLSGGGALSGDLTLALAPGADGSHLVSRGGQTTWEAMNFVTTGRRLNTTAPLSGGGALSGDLTLGLAPASEGDILRFKGGAWSYGKLYELCEIYCFRHPTLKPGFQPAQGGLLENAATLYLEAWAYLQTTEGQLLCKTEAQWQSMTTATWATLADGTKVGWNGIGGASFYALHTDTGALRLPDLRGMYAEAAGFDSLGVGGAHGDGERGKTGIIGTCFDTAHGATVSGPFYRTTDAGSVPASGVYYAYVSRMDVSRVVPVAAKNQPRAWGALACVYLGTPAS